MVYSKGFSGPGGPLNKRDEIEGQLPVGGNLLHKRDEVVPVLGNVLKKRDEIVPVLGEVLKKRDEIVGETMNGVLSKRCVCVSISNAYKQLSETYVSLHTNTYLGVLSI